MTTSSARRCSVVQFTHLALAALVGSLLTAPVATASPLAAQADAFNQRLDSPMAQTRGRLGGGLAVGNRTAVVGAPGDSTLGPDSGIAHVFKRDQVTGVYTLEEALQPPGIQPFDRFGDAMAIGGNILVIGAKGDDEAAPNAGAAYVYRRFGVDAPFGLVAKLLAPSAGISDCFGSSVAVLGDKIAIGAPGADDVSFNAGAVYTYSFDLPNNSVSLDGPVDDPGLSAGDGFGVSLAVAPGILVVGAERLDAPTGLANTGGVMVFFALTNGPSTTWHLSQEIFPSSATPYARFGAAVALSPPRPGVTGTLVVGAPDAADPVSGTEKGSVSIFEATMGGAWAEVFTYGTQLPGNGNELGTSLALDGDDILAGAPGRGDIVNMIYDRGPVDRLRRTGGAWSVAGTIELPDADSYWTVGESVALQDGYPLIGAPGADFGTGLQYQGAVWSVSDLWAPLGDTICSPAVPNSRGVPASLAIRGSVSAAAQDLVLEVGYMPRNSFAYALVAPQSGFSAQPGGSQGILCLSGSVGRMVDRFAQAGADGRITIPVDLVNLPQPLGFVTVVPGDVWWFQVWYRDANPGVTSNFTDAVSITFE